MRCKQALNNFTSEIYTHMITRSIQQIKSSFDDLKEKINIFELIKNTKQTFANLPKIECIYESLYQI